MRKKKEMKIRGLLKQLRDAEKMTPEVQADIDKINKMIYEAMRCAASRSAKR